MVLPGQQAHGPLLRVPAARAQRRRARGNPEGQQAELVPRRDLPRPLRGEGARVPLRKGHPLPLRGAVRGHLRAHRPQAGLRDHRGRAQADRAADARDDGEGEQGQGQGLVAKRLLRGAHPGGRRAGTGGGLGAVEQRREQARGVGLGGAAPVAGAHGAHPGVDQRALERDERAQALLRVLAHERGRRLEQPAAVVHRVAGDEHALEEVGVGAAGVARHGEGEHLLVRGHGDAARARHAGRHAEVARVQQHARQARDEAGVGALAVEQGGVVEAHEDLPRGGLRRQPVHAVDVVEVAVGEEEVAHVLGPRVQRPQRLLHRRGGGVHAGVEHQHPRAHPDGVQVHVRVAHAHEARVQHLLGGGELVLHGAAAHERREEEHHQRGGQDEGDFRAALHGDFLRRGVAAGAGAVRAAGRVTVRAGAARRAGFLAAAGTARNAGRGGGALATREAERAGGALATRGGGRSRA